MNWFTIVMIINCLFLAVMLTSLVYGILWQDEMNETIELVPCSVNPKELPEQYRDDFFNRCNPQIEEFLEERGLRIGSG